MEKSKKGQLKFYLYDHRTRVFLEIGDGSVCGRNDGDILFPQDDLLSRRHCRFFVAGSDVYIQDFGSTNRTKINSVPIEPYRKRRVLLNDVIDIGNQRLILTHQNLYAPSHIQDVRTPVFKVRKSEDGSLTRVVTGFITTKTLVLLDRAGFRKLKLQKAAKSAFSYSRMLIWIAIPLVAGVVLLLLNPS